MAAGGSLGITNGDVEISARLHGPVKIAPVATQLSAIMTENGAAAPTAPAAAVSGRTLVVVLSGHQLSALMASPSISMKVATANVTTTTTTTTTTIFVETTIAADLM